MKTIKIDEEGYSCKGFTVHKLDQITMDEIPSYLISYSESRGKSYSGVKTYTVWEIYIPISYRTAFAT